MAKLMVALSAVLFCLLVCGTSAQGGPQATAQRPQRRQQSNRRSGATRAQRPGASAAQSTQQDSGLLEGLIQRPPGSSPQRRFTIRETLSLLKATTKQAVDRFLDNPAAVTELVLCFEHPNKCPSRTILVIIRGMPEIFRRGSRCVTCTPREEKYLRRVLGGAVVGLQQRYRKQWNTIVTYVADYL